MLANVGVHTAKTQVSKGLQAARTVECDGVHGLVCGRGGRGNAGALAPTNYGPEKTKGAILRNLKAQRLLQGGSWTRTKRRGHEKQRDVEANKLKLVLTALEAEVTEAALELYLQTRPMPIDDRFEYRYRAAQSVLANLRHGHREPGTFARGDDEATGRSGDERLERGPLREQAED